MIAWPETKLGEIAETTSGGTPDRKNPEYFSGSIPWVKSGELEDNFITSTEERITELALQNSAAKLLPVGTLLMAMYGATVGKTAILRLKAATNQAICAITPKKELIDTEFLRLALIYQRAEILKQRYGGAQPNISQQIIRNLSIPTPPLREQRKIAVVLGLVQRAIEQEERLLSLTAELKRTLLHKLFTHGLRNEPQKQTELGPIPESWEVVKLVDLFGIKHGFAFDGEYFKESGEYILLTPGHFHEDGGFRDQATKTKYYTGEIPSGYLLQEGDLLVAMTEQKSGLLGSSAIIPSKGKFLHNQRLGLIVDLQGIRLDKLFLSYLFNTAPVRIEIAKTSSGSKVRHTSPRKILDIKIALPPLAEQRDIAATLQALDAKLDLAKRKRDALSALFHTLLRELMTAHIRIDRFELVDLKGNE